MTSGFLVNLRIHGEPLGYISAANVVRAEHGRWEHAGQRYFDGEVEPCINGRTIETGAYFGVDVAPLVDRVLGERLEDGGWNCDRHPEAAKSSFMETLIPLRALVLYARTSGERRVWLAAERAAGLILRG